MAIANPAPPWVSVTERAPTKAATRFVHGLFWMTLVFQTTSLKYIWGLEGVARIANLGMLAVLCVVAMYALFFERFDRLVWYLYIVPGLLVFAGMFVNTTRNAVLDASAMSYYGLILPWAAFLAAPMLCKARAIDSERLWRYFYYFMVAAVALGLLDYVAVFFGGTVLRSTMTPEGAFLIGRFSLLYGLEDGSAHTRFYACFAEPGTLAMYLLPAIAYALQHRRFIGLIVMLVGLALTVSLGGLIGLMLLIAVLAFAKMSSGRYAVIGLVTALVVSLILWFAVGDYVKESYSERANSRTVREGNIQGTLLNLPDLLLSYPLGFEFSTPLMEQQQDSRVTLGTFTVGNALQLGGIAGFLGYTTTLLVSVCSAGVALLRRGLNAHARMVFCSMIVLFSFVVQRVVVWDSALFAFLFAPTLLGLLASPNRHTILAAATDESP